MDAAEIHRLLRERLGTIVSDELKPGDWPVCEVRGQSIAEVCAMLRDEPGMDFDCLSNLTAVDRKADDTIEVFAEILNRAGYASPVRTPRGRDIMAACGQLKSAAEKKSRAELDRLAEEKQAALG